MPGSNLNLIMGEDVRHAERQAEQRTNCDGGWRIILGSEVLGSEIVVNDEGQERDRALWRRAHDVEEGKRRRDDKSRSGCVHTLKEGLGAWVGGRECPKRERGVDEQESW